MILRLMRGVLLFGSIASGCARPADGPPATEVPAAKSANVGAAQPETPPPATSEIPTPEIPEPATQTSHAVGAGDCGGQACAAPKQCIRYVGVAGPSVPLFTCGIPCEPDGTCPGGAACTAFPDGPRICR